MRLIENYTPKLLIMERHSLTEVGTGVNGQTWYAD
jgi:hypothetical protein